MSLEGVSEADVILDAEGTASVIRCINTAGINISNITITGGRASDYGGGIYCSSNSMFNLHNARITGNEAYYGGGIYCNGYFDTELKNLTIADNQASGYGGGIYFDAVTNTKLENLEITGNSAGQAGGGMCLTGTMMNKMKSVTIRSNSAYIGGGMYVNYDSYPLFDSLQRCNIFLNDAVTGNDLSSYDNSTVIMVIVDTFTVITPNEYHAFPLENFTFDVLHGKLEQVDADLYVSPSGNNNNSGLSEDEPLKTIHSAFSRMLVNAQNRNILHLMEGTYGPSSNGDLLPIKMIDYVHLSGVSENSVILDGEGVSGVVLFDNARQTGLAGMTITNGNSDNGAGINIENSAPVLENLVINGNSATADGGGIYISGDSIPVLKNTRIINNHANNGAGMYFYNNSQGELQDLDIKNNIAVIAGGGIFLNRYANAAMQNTTIAENEAAKGGGIYFSNYSSINFDSIDRCNIYLNEAGAGKDLFTEYNVQVIVDTFTVITPKYNYAYPLGSFTFDILNGKIPLINADVYLAPNGDNANSGLTPDEPLKTISFATSIMAEDSQHPNTIRLLNGTYSTSVTGEPFPVFIPDYISLAGESEEGVILDAEGQSRVLEIIGMEHTGFSNLTITGGDNNQSGGGIFISHSKPVLTNLTVQKNATREHGGGIYLAYSDAEIEHVTLKITKQGWPAAGFFATNPARSCAIFQS